MTATIAIDIGGTNTKFGVKRGPDWFVFFAVPSAPLFEHGPEQCWDKIYDCIVKHTCESVKIERLFVSVTGTVENGVLIGSERLRDFSQSSAYNHWSIEEYFYRKTGASIVRVLHDGHGHGIGCLYDNIQFPILILALGTYPAVTIVDKSEQVNIYSATSHHLLVGTRNGEEPVYLCTNAAVMKQLETNERRSSRVKRTLHRLLEGYQNMFQFHPKSIVLSGGISNCLERQIVETGLSQHVQIDGTYERKLKECIDWISDDSIVSKTTFHYIDLYPDSTNCV